jgi:hypothetical protein
VIAEALFEVACHTGVQSAIRAFDDVDSPPANGDSFLRFRPDKPGAPLRTRRSTSTPSDPRVEY